MGYSMSMADTLDAADEDYERLVETYVAALPHGRGEARRPRAVRRMQAPGRDTLRLMWALYKCGGWSRVEDAEAETGIVLTRKALFAVSPWVRVAPSGLRLTAHGRKYMRREAAADAQ